MSKASVYFTLGDLEHKQDTKAIKRALDAFPGVNSVSISDGSHCVAVDFDTTGVQPDKIRKKLEKMGYQVLDSRTDSHVM